MPRHFLLSLVFFLLSLALFGCGGDEGGIAATEKYNQPTSVKKLETGVTRGYPLADGIWPANPIGVCWELDDAGMSSSAWERGVAKKAVEDTWVANSNLSFTGWDKCKPDESFYGIRIAVGDVQPVYRYGLLGYQNNNKPHAMILNLSFQAWSPYDCFNTVERCIKIAAVHEFGHALGFAHEQNRPDRPENCEDPSQGADGDIAFGPYDPDSVMDYCNPVWMNDGNLSTGDINMVQHFYGKKPRLMYVAKYSMTPQWIAAFEMENGESVAQIAADPMASDGVARLITHLVSSPDGKFVVYANQPLNGPGAHIHTIDTTTNKIVKTTMIDEEILDLKISPDSKTLYVLWLNQQNHTGVRLLDASTNSTVGNIPLDDAKLLATPRIRNDTIYALTAKSDNSAQSIVEMNVPGHKIEQTYSVGPAGNNGMNLGLSFDEKKVYFLAHESVGDSTPRIAALDLANGTYSKLQPLPAGLDVFDMQVLNTDNILIGSHIDSEGPRIYDINTGKVSVVHTGSNQDGPYLYVYSPDSGQNIYAMSDGQFGGNLNWFSRQQDLSYVGGDIGMYSFGMHSFVQKRPFALAN